MNNIRRGDIFYADLSPVIGSELPMSVQKSLAEVWIDGGLL